MQKLVLGAAMLCSLAGAALAQTTTAPAPSTTAPAPAAPAPSTTAPRTGTAPMASTSADASSMGLRMASSATVAIKFVTVKPADFMSSRLVGANVYNNQNETVGEIEDLVIDNGKTVSGLVVGVGGFLGMGESYVVLDPSTVVLNQQDGKWRAYVDTTKDNLKNAPKFTYTKMRR